MERVFFLMTQLGVGEEMGFFERGKRKAVRLPEKIT